MSGVNSETRVTSETVPLEIAVVHMHNQLAAIDALTRYSQHQLL
jgi:hypothetical protein